MCKYESSEELGSKFVIKDTTDEQDAITWLLKNAELQLMYKADYKRIKLLSILELFGYER